MANKDLGREVGVATAYGILSFLFLLPISLEPATSVAYVGDGLGTVYFVTDMARRLVGDPAHLFQAGLAYPHANASLFEAHRIVIALLAAPFLAASGNPILATNAVTLLAYAFNGWAARRLALRLGLRGMAAFVAGCLFAFNTYALNEEPRVNVIFIGFLPLALGSFLAYLETGVPREAWKVAFFMLIQGYTENYHVVYGALLLGLVLIPYLLLRPRATLIRLSGLFLPGLIAAALFLPIVNAYLAMDREYDYRREAPPTMGLEHYLAPLPGNVLYGWLESSARSQQLGPHFVGLLALVLAALAVGGALRRRDLVGDGASLLPPRIWVFAASCLAGVFLLLSLGRSVQWDGITLMPGPFGFLYDHVGLFQRLRIPERLSLLVMLFVGLLAARGIMLVPWHSLRLALCVLLPLEHFAILKTWVDLPREAHIPYVYRFLKTDLARAVAEAPIHGEGLVRMESLDMYYSLFHHKPIVAAYVSFPPLLTTVLRRAVSEFPSLETLDILRRVGVDTVVVHDDRVGGAAMNRAALEDALRFDLRPVGVFSNFADVLTQSGRNLGDRGLDVVYRIKPRPLGPKAGFPVGSRVLDDRWVYRSTAGKADALGDGDPDTLWAIADPIRGGESVEVSFPDQTVPVSGLVLPLTRLQVLPSAFVIEGRTATGAWEGLALYDAGHRRQLIDNLLTSPGRARLGFAFDPGPRLVSGVRLRALPGAKSFDGWRLSEIEILTIRPKDQAKAGLAVQP